MKRARQWLSLSKRRSFQSPYFSPEPPRLVSRTWAGVLFASFFLASSAPAAGPDLTVLSLTSATNFGTEGDFQAYSLGTTTCNQGDQPVRVCISSNEPTCQENEHPVMAQNLYRLENGSFRQIGMSWLLHFFAPLNSQAAACGTCAPPTSPGNRLGAGCTDTHSASIHGARPLGPRSEVNAATGAFPFPFTQVAFSGNVDQRLRVLRTDLEPSLHPDARYFAEGHHTAADDAAAGNAFNNASYREVQISPATLSLNPMGATTVGLPAIFAWAEADAEVQVLAVDIPSSSPPLGASGERFHAARKITATPSGWKIEYAIHNLSSDRSAGSFSVDFPPGTRFPNHEFYAIEHHSGEPYDTAPWTSSFDGSSITWSTDLFSTNPNANALRWGTMFNFIVEADALPTAQTLGLFKPGSPDSVSLPFDGEGLFADGFESGDVGAWSGAVP